MVMNSIYAALYLAGVMMSSTVADAAVVIKEYIAAPERVVNLCRVMANAIQAQSEAIAQLEEAQAARRDCVRTNCDFRAKVERRVSSALAELEFRNAETNFSSLRYVHDEGYVGRSSAPVVAFMLGYRYPVGLYINPEGPSEDENSLKTTLPLEVIRGRSRLYPYAINSGYLLVTVDNDVHEGDAARIRILAREETREEQSAFSAGLRDYVGYVHYEVDASVEEVCRGIEDSGGVFSIETKFSGRQVPPVGLTFVRVFMARSSSLEIGKTVDLVDYSGSFVGDILGARIPTENTRVEWAYWREDGFQSVCMKNWIRDTRARLAQEAGGSEWPTTTDLIGRMNVSFEWWLNDSEIPVMKIAIGFVGELSQDIYLTKREGKLRIIGTGVGGERSSCIYSESVVD